jgi:hypothetical protein
MEADHQREYQRPVKQPDTADGFWKDASFDNLILQNPRLAGLKACVLPDHLPFDGREHVLSAFSSYESHQYDLLFYALVRLLRPQRCLELGVLEGFSLLAMASALRDNGAGHITGYDLFAKYPFRHAVFDEVWSRCRTAHLDPYITLRQGNEKDAFAHHSEVDILHVDLSNDGEIYRKLFSQWADKVRLAVLLEGGSAERDRIPWMHEHNKPSIAEAISELRKGYPDWIFTVVDPFPSMTLAFRR